MCEIRFYILIMSKKEKIKKNESKGFDFTKVKSLIKKMNKKYLIIGSITGTVIVLPILFLTVMYFSPIKTFSYDKDNNTFSYSKFPIYSSNVKVYRNDELIKEENLSGTKGEIYIDFTQDGFYKIEYKVASKTTVEEFEIDRTAPEINVEFSDLTNEEQTPLNVSLNEEGTVWVKYIKTVTDENTGDKNEEEVALDVVDNQVNLELREGDNMFTVYAKDEWDNEAKKDVLVVADYTNPKIELVLPNYKETYNTTSEVKCKVSDENGVEKVTINGEEVKQNEDGFYVLSISLKDGDNGIEIIAWDKAGNKKEETSNVLKKVGAVDRIDKIGGGTTPTNPDIGGGTQPITCSDTKSGYNVYCYINELRNSAGLSSMSWNSTNANYSYWYAYCLQTTGFKGDPHYPTQDVYDCYDAKVGNVGYIGNDIHSYGYSTASGVANGWWNSPVHKGIVSNGSNIGIGCYGSWCSATVN